MCPQTQAQNQRTTPGGAVPMQEIQAQDQGRAGSKDSAGVIYFAAQVVSLLAERNWRTFSEVREPVVRLVLDNEGLLPFTTPVSLSGQ